MDKIGWKTWQCSTFDWRKMGPAPKNKFISHILSPACKGSKVWATRNTTPQWLSCIAELGNRSHRECLCCPSKEKSNNKRFTKRVEINWKSFWTWHGQTTAAPFVLFGWIVPCHVTDFCFGSCFWSAEPVAWWVGCMANFVAAQLTCKIRLM